MMATSPYVTHRLEAFGSTIFAQMSELAAATGSLNLGQGFPDYDGPPEIFVGAQEAMAAGFNQYCHGAGVLELRQAIAEHQDRFYGLHIDPEEEVLVTTGATEAIAAVLLGILNAGDEVIAFEPFYDSYAACISLADAQLVPVTLRGASWDFDPEELRAAFGPRTRALLLNTPHNPTGKIFSLDELQLIAELAADHDCLVIADEVYEHLCFDAQHVPISSLPAMAERTLTISSGGKTFSCTGWKVGWVTGPAQLVSAARSAKQFLSYVNSSPLQYGIAAGLRLGDEYFRGLAADLAAKRAVLADGFRAIGIEPFWPASGYFMSIDVGPLGFADGMEFCQHIAHTAQLVAIPSQVFYQDPTRGLQYVRWAFCKRDVVLAEACERLLALAAVAQS
jgi:N-succinyldiaminopimelate aminotransferase